jgi:hypothetical protein
VSGSGLRQAAQGIWRRSRLLAHGDADASTRQHGLEGLRQVAIFIIVVITMFDGWKWANYWFLGGPKPGATSTYTPSPYTGGDLDCEDIGREIRIGPSDPHGLDRDDDGIGCGGW